MPNAPHAGLLHAFAGLNPLDWAIVLLLVSSAVTAFLRGLIRSVVSLVGMVAGLVVGAWYAPVLAVSLERWIDQPALAEVAAFAVLFAAVFLLLSLLGRVLRSASSAVGLGLVDRLGGALFGVGRAVLLLAVALVPASPFLPLLPFARDSVLLPYLRTAAHGVSFVVPQDFGKWMAAAVRQVGPATPPPIRFPQHEHRGRTATDLSHEGDEP